jgi:ribonuclease Z
LNSKNFSITFLGTAAASWSPQSPTSSYLVEINQSRILIDVGIGALRQLRKLRISPDDIDIILVTHWHLDHYAGLPTMLRARRKPTPLSIYGPPISRMVRLFLTISRYPFGRIFEPVSGDFFRSYKGLGIQAIPNSHNVESYGWAISEGLHGNSHEGRRIVISGDTRPTDTILNAAQGADLLVHEATYLERDARTAFLHQHSTAAQAAELAIEAGVGALALTHVPSRYSRREVKEEAQRIFTQVFLPFPLDTVRLDPLSEGDAKNNPG